MDNNNNKTNADKSLEHLLSDSFQEQLIDDTSRSFAAYVPVMRAEQPQTGRWTQLFRVLFEFSIGGPTKFIKSFREYMEVMDILNNAHHLPALIRTLLFPLKALLAIFMSFTECCKKFARSIWFAVLFREMEFIPKAEFKTSLNSPPSE